jgi:hypothetical protein
MQNVDSAPYVHHGSLIVATKELEEHQQIASDDSKLNGPVRFITDQSLKVVQSFAILPMSEVIDKLVVCAPRNHVRVESTFPSEVADSHNG